VLAWLPGTFLCNSQSLLEEEQRYGSKRGPDSYAPQFTKKHHRIIIIIILPCDNWRCGLHAQNLSENLVMRSLRMSFLTLNGAVSLKNLRNAFGRNWFSKCCSCIIASRTSGLHQTQRTDIQVTTAPYSRATLQRPFIAWTFNTWCHHLHIVAITSDCKTYTHMQIIINNSSFHLSRHAPVLASSSQQPTWKGVWYRGVDGSKTEHNGWFYLAPGSACEFRSMLLWRLYTGDSNDIQ